MPERSRLPVRTEWHLRAHYSTRRGAFLMPRRGRKESVMADENVQEVEQMEEPQGEDKNETDWKAEARKWEARAKKSISAEEELAALKQAQMTEQEKATARAEKAEAELAEYKAEAERHNAAREIAESEGVPLGLLEYCADADAMKRFAAEYKASQVPVHAAASASGSKIVRDGNMANRDKFAAAVKGLF